MLFFLPEQADFPRKISENKPESTDLLLLDLGNTAYATVSCEKNSTAGWLHKFAAWSIILVQDFAGYTIFGIGSVGDEPTSFMPTCFSEILAPDAFCADICNIFVKCILFYKILYYFPLKMSRVSLIIIVGARVRT